MGGADHGVRLGRELDVQVVGKHRPRSTGLEQAARLAERPDADLVRLDDHRVPGRRCQTRDDCDGAEHPQPLDLHVAVDEQGLALGHDQAVGGGHQAVDVTPERGSRRGFGGAPQEGQGDAGEGFRDAHGGLRGSGSILHAPAAPEWGHLPRTSSAGPALDLPVRPPVTGSSDLDCRTVVPVVAGHSTWWPSTHPIPWVPIRPDLTSRLPDGCYGPVTVMLSDS